MSLICVFIKSMEGPISPDEVNFVQINEWQVGTDRNLLL